jgi:TetR/AcrR family transcriptional repressor of mexJK operon
VSEKKPSARRKVGREAIIRAAAEIFLEQGYAATSIDSIIERVGGSNRNIYTEFGNKEGLFTAIATHHLDKVLSTLAIEDRKGSELPKALVTFGCLLMEMLMSPNLLGVFRIVVTENARFPELARKFYEDGPRRASETLAKMLRDARARGDIGAVDCAAAADHFVALIRGNLHLEVVLGLRPPPSAREIRKVVNSAVDLFIGGVGISTRAEYGRGGAK